MALLLYERLSDCVVKVITSDMQGSGFFVAPGLILTCAHVVDNAQQSGASPSIQILWQGQTYPASIAGIPKSDALDLALLKVTFTNHPCVLLAGGADPRVPLFTFGYPDIEQEGATTSFEGEGWIGQNQELIRLKGGQARPGMSGSPLLNEVTGGVCGIIDSTRDERSDLGGTAIPAQTIFTAFPTLVEAQKTFHIGNRRWSDALTQAQREKLQLKWLPSPTVPDKLKVFVSYSQRDEALKEEFDDAVVMLRRNNLIESWSAQDITGAQEKDVEIQKHLDTAHIIILLVSNAFLASNALYDTEMKRAMERHEAGTARIVPIILRPCEWRDTPFGKLLGLPRNGKPITSWSNRDEAFYDVAKDLRRVVEDLKKNLTPF